MTEENLHTGHRQRMRAAYRKLGLPAEGHKQLEMLLFYVLPQVDTNKIAHRLINRFGSLRGVLDASPQELTEIEGVGKAAAEFLHFIGDISREYGKKPPDKPGRRLDTPEKAEALVREQLGGQKSECVLAVFLDAKQRLIHEHLTVDAAGSAARVGNSPRVVAGLALRTRAAGVLIGHNHPDGSPMPSQRDMAEAVRVKDALRAIGTTLTDFIIVGEDGETYSLLRGGLI